VDVQPYAFTTKSLFVGHTDYKYLRWQVIDTPGILDRPLEDRNTIEMQVSCWHSCILDVAMDWNRVLEYTVPASNCSLANRSLLSVWHSSILLQDEKGELLFRMSVCFMFLRCPMRQATCCTETVLQHCHAVPTKPITSAACVQSITALAHLRAAVLYVMDISEQCGYTIAQQAALFHSIKPLFSNKPLMIVANKTDAAPLSSLSEADNATLRDMVSAAATASNGGEDLLLQCTWLHHSLHGYQSRRLPASCKFIDSTKYIY